MHRKPIGPTAHGLIDYVFAFATLNALTDTPVGLVALAPPRTHVKLETPCVSAIPAPPWITGAFRRRNARLDFGVFFAAAAANYLLTDHNAHEPGKLLPGGQALVERLEAVIA